jgi:hypothetical protein
VWQGTPQSPGAQTRFGAERIRSSIALYRVLIVLQLLGAIIGAAVSIATNTPYAGGAGGFSVSSGSASARSVAASVALAGGLGILLLVLILILTIISWLRWRDGIRRIASESGAMGPTHFRQAQEARKHYSYTVWTFITYILVAIIAAFVIVALIIGGLVGHFNPTNNSFTPPTSAQVQATQKNLTGAIAGIAVIGALFNFLLYYFASASLREAIGGVASPDIVRQLDSGRRYILIGVIIGFGGVASFFFSYASLISIAVPVFLLLGFSAILTGYDQYLATPTGPPSVSPR